MDKLDIIVLTKNSMPGLRYMMTSLLNSDIPINKVIFVDGYSTDSTLEYIYSLDIPVKVILDKGNRATARQIGIDNVETEWFLFLDSDIILPKKWFLYAKEYMDDDNIGAIWGTAINISIHDYNRYKALKYLYRTNIVEIARIQGEKRGYTHDTLIRSDAVRGIKIPKYLHTFEDHYIRRYVEKKGYRWLAIYPPYCFHRHEYKSSDKKDWYLTGYFGKKLDFYTKTDIAKYLSAGLLKSLFISMLSGDINSGIIQYLNYIYVVTGYLKAVFS